MKPVYPVFKPYSATPLELVRALKARDPSLTSVRIGYAGRLDPMAEGLLLLLAGEENKKKSLYENLSKTYVIRVVFGIATDTYDGMGLVTETGTPAFTDKELRTAVLTLIGTTEQPYPPYSAKTVGGIPLYRHARNGTIHTVTLPVKTVTISDIRILSESMISEQELSADLEKRITDVHGNFRQKEILACWKDVLSSSRIHEFPSAALEITATSGTYMRSVAHNLGKILNTCAFAYTISRTRIGTYTAETAERLLS